MTSLYSLASRRNDPFFRQIMPFRNSFFSRTDPFFNGGIYDIFGDFDRMFRDSILIQENHLHQRQAPDEPQQQQNDQEPDQQQELPHSPYPRVISSSTSWIRDSQGHERYVERRGINGQHRTRRWDTRDVDENGSIRHYTTDQFKSDHSSVTDADEFEREWNQFGWHIFNEISPVTLGNGDNPQPNEPHHQTAKETSKEPPKNLLRNPSDVEGHVSDVEESNQNVKTDGGIPLFDNPK